MTHDGIVNMQAVEVANLVLENFASDMPTAPPNLMLELVPSALKTRMSALLAKLATPSSVQAIEKSAKRMRDPRIRRDPRLKAQNKEQPALVPIFDETAVEEVSDWISKNAATIAEPLVSVSEVNVVQVHLKSETAAWQHEMAIDALVRILENEYGVKIRGDEALREGVVCRLASSPWLLSTDENSKPVSESSNDSPKLPFVYQKILDFVLGDYPVRSTLATNLICQEYIRATASQLDTATAATPAGTADYKIYRTAVNYFFDALQKKMDLSSSADKKLLEVWWLSCLVYRWRFYALLRRCLVKRLESCLVSLCCVTLRRSGRRAKRRVFSFCCGTHATKTSTTAILPFDVWLTSFMVLEPSRAILKRLQLSW